MAYLIVGLVLFLGVHSTSIVAPAWRDRMVAKLGEGGWKGLYSVITVIGIVLIIYGYGRARFEPVVLYTPPFWLRHVSALLMLPVFPLIIAAYFPGRIKAALGHPMLVGVKLWALAHLLSNGTLADVLLFGGFLLWAGADRMSLKRRTQRIPQVGEPSLRNDVIAVVLGLVIYAVFAFYLHIRLIGVPVMPVGV